MPQTGPLRWLDGEGWLVLIGGGDVRRGETDQVDVQLLSVANLDRPMLVLTGGGSPRQAEEILEHYTALGGPGGQAIALPSSSTGLLDTPEIVALIRETGILYLGGEDPLALVAGLYGSTAFRRVVEGFSTLQGLTLVGSGSGAAALGRWAFSPDPPHQQAMGLGFLMNAVVVPHFTATEDSPVLRALPQIDESMLGLGIPDGTALALGPQGQLETWGDGQVTAVVSAGDAAP